MWNSIAKKWFYMPKSLRMVLRTTLCAQTSHDVDLVFIGVIKWLSCRMGSMTISCACEWGRDNLVTTVMGTKS